jgi:hypothetical protein
MAMPASCAHAASPMSAHTTFQPYARERTPPASAAARLTSAAASSSTARLARKPTERQSAQKAAPSPSQSRGVGKGSQAPVTEEHLRCRP